MSDFKEAGMAFSGIIFIPTFKKTGQLVQRAKRGNSMVNSCVHSSPLAFFVAAYSDILNRGLCGLLQCAELSEDEF